MKLWLVWRVQSSGQISITSPESQIRALSLSQTDCFLFDSSTADTNAPTLLYNPLLHLKASPCGGYTLQCFL